MLFTSLINLNFSILNKFIFQLINKGSHSTIKEATSSSIRKKMDDVRLRADYENLQNLMNRIPPEILELAKRGQLTHSDRER